MDAAIGELRRGDPLDAISDESRYELADTLKREFRERGCPLLFAKTDTVSGHQCLELRTKWCDCLDSLTKKGITGAAGVAFMSRQPISAGFGRVDLAIITGVSDPDALLESQLLILTRRIRARVPAPYTCVVHVTAEGAQIIF